MLDYENLLINVARGYYFDNLSQNELGKIYKTSRSTISRMLKEARESGIVKITINNNLSRAPNLEKEMLKTFSLRECWVFDGEGLTESEIDKGIGKLSAQYIEKIIENNSIITISLGRTIANMIRALTAKKKDNVTVVQMIGTLGAGNPLLDAPNLVRDFSEKFQANYRYLNAPLLVEDNRTREFIERTSSVKEVLMLARKANVAIVGIGILDPNAKDLIWTGYLNSKDANWLREKQAVGNMCAQHFDINGHILEVELNKRIIGIGLDNLHHIPTTIAISGGIAKTKAILGALRGKFMNVLITDSQTAKEVIKLNKIIRN